MFRIGIFYLLLIAGAIAYFGFARTKEHLQEMHQPGTRVYILPQEVQSAMHCIRELGLERYSLLGTLRASAPLFQRLVESAWPAKVEAYFPTAVLIKKDLGLCHSPKIRCTHGETLVADCLL